MPRKYVRKKSLFKSLDRQPDDPMPNEIRQRATAIRRGWRTKHPYAQGDRQNAAGIRVIAMAEVALPS